jgi:copper chaperone CopZ
MPQRVARISVTHMDCADCASSVETHINKMYAAVIVKLSVSVMTNEANVQYYYQASNNNNNNNNDNGSATIQAIVDAITNLGFPSTLVFDKEVKNTNDDSEPDPVCVRLQVQVLPPSTSALNVDAVATYIATEFAKHGRVGTHVA